MAFWIDTHCHLDALEFAACGGPQRVREEARAAGVGRIVIPAVDAGNFAAVRELAHRTGDGYALGFHPLYLPQGEVAEALERLDGHLREWQDDPHLVAVGEIGLDAHDGRWNDPAVRIRQEALLRGQLRLARRYGLPVLLHTRRAVDAVLRHLRELPPPGAIAHAFVGSLQQAEALCAVGAVLGFGGAMTFERATRLRAQAATLPLDSLVLETDAPDIPPSWLYVPQEVRRAGQVVPPNRPAEIPRMGAVLADLRGMPVEELCAATTANALRVLPRLAVLGQNTEPPAASAADLSAGQPAP